MPENGMNVVALQSKLSNTSGSPYTKVLLKIADAKTLAERFNSIGSIGFGSQLAEETAGVRMGWAIGLQKENVTTNVYLPCCSMLQKED